MDRTRVSLRLPRNLDERFHFNGYQCCFKATLLLEQSRKRSDLSFVKREISVPTYRLELS
jgi:hypothetical protein